MTSCCLIPALVETKKEDFPRYQTNMFFPLYVTAQFNLEVTPIVFSTNGVAIKLSESAIEKIKGFFDFYNGEPFMVKFVKNYTINCGACYRVFGSCLDCSKCFSCECFVCPDNCFGSCCSEFSKETELNIAPSITAESILFANKRFIKFLLTV